MRSLVPALALAFLLGSPASAQTPSAPSAAPAAVPAGLQYAELIKDCEKAKACLANQASCTAKLEAQQCISYLEGIYTPMRLACNSRKTNKNFPAAMAMRDATIGQKIDAVIKYGKDNAGDLVKHKGVTAVRAFAKELPCEN